MARHVIEHAHLINAEAVLWPGDAPKLLDPALTYFRGSVPEIPFDRVAHSCPKMSLQVAQIVGGFGRENDVIFHSGQNIARIGVVVNQKRGRVGRLTSSSPGPACDPRIKCRIARRAREQHLLGAFLLPPALRVYLASSIPPAYLPKRLYRSNPFLLSHVDIKSATCRLFKSEKGKCVLPLMPTSGK